jgi:MFS family permease
VAFLSFSPSAVLVWVGSIVWGAAMGVHESTMRAAVADMVPAARRGVGYGTFTAAYGLAWLAGGTILGALYDHSIPDLITFTVITQVLATHILAWEGEVERLGAEAARPHRVTYRKLTGNDRRCAPEKAVPAWCRCRATVSTLRSIPFSAPGARGNGPR